jgi:hypothetical protein
MSHQYLSLAFQHASRSAFFRNFSDLGFGSDIPAAVFRKTVTPQKEKNLSENFKISAHGLFICLFVCLLGTQKISLH